GAAGEPARGDRGQPRRPRIEDDPSRSPRRRREPRHDPPAPRRAADRQVIRPPELRTKPLTVTLYRRDPAVYELTRIGSHELAVSDDEVAFDAVTPADHVVVVQGAEPLARISAPVKVEEGKAA